MSRTCASCDADKGSGLREGMGRRSVSLGPEPEPELEPLAAIVAMYRWFSWSDLWSAQRELTS